MNAKCPYRPLTPQTNRRRPRNAWKPCLTRLDLDPAACGAILDQACGDDLNLRQYVQQLPASSADAENNPGWSESAELKVVRASADAVDPGARPLLPSGTRRCGRNGCRLQGSPFQGESGQRPGSGVAHGSQVSRRSCKPAG